MAEVCDLFLEKSDEEIELEIEIDDNYEDESIEVDDNTILEGGYDELID